MSETGAVSPFRAEPWESVPLVHQIAGLRSVVVGLAFAAVGIIFSASRWGGNDWV